MRITQRIRSIFIAAALVTTGAALPACGKAAADDITAENIADQGAVTEQHDSGAVTWAVAPDGQVRALVKAPDGKPFDKNVTGTLTVKGPEENAVPLTVPLVADPKTGLYVATIPKLEGDLTEVKYDLEADGKPMKGALHLPPGGTPELTANAKLAAEVKLPDGKKGPNGGVIQVVGDDTVEVVADKGSGKVRVYILDKDLKPVVVGERKVKIAVVGQAPETVVLVPEPGGLYFTGKLNTVVVPTKLTVAVTHHDVTKVVLVGYQPATVIVVGPSAPGIAILVNTGWDVNVKVHTKPVIVVHDDDDDDDHHHHHHHGKGKGHWKGKGVHIKIH